MIWNAQISARWLANPNRDHSHFPHTFSELVCIPYPLSKWRFSKLPYTLPHPQTIMLTIAGRMVNKNLSNSFSTHVLLVTILKFTPNHTSLKYGCMFKIRHQITHIYLKSTHPKGGFTFTVWVQESWGPKPLWMDLTLQSQDWTPAGRSRRRFLILGGEFSWMGITVIQQESDAL